MIGAVGNGIVKSFPTTAISRQKKKSPVRCHAHDIDNILHDMEERILVITCHNGRVAEEPSA